MSSKKKGKKRTDAVPPAQVHPQTGTIAHLNGEGGVNSILYQMHGRETVDLGHGRDRPAGPVTRGDKLGMASEMGDLVLVEKLLKKGVDPNFRNAASGVTPLGVASERGHLEVMRALLDAGASVNNPTNEGVTPIHIACQFGPAAGVELLCRRGADVNTPCPLFANAGPLLFATQLNKPRAIEVLIAAGARVNGSDRKGWTPLHAAASFGHLKVVQALLEGKADPLVTTKKGESPLDVALNKGHSDCVELLRSAGCGEPRALTAAGAPVDADTALGAACSALSLEPEPAATRAPPPSSSAASTAAIAITDALAALPPAALGDGEEEDAPSVARAKRIFHENPNDYKGRGLNH